jgi:hypothetical protein
MKITFNNRLREIILFLTVLMIVSSCIEEGENSIDGRGTNFLRIIASKDTDGGTLKLSPNMNRTSAAFDAVPTTGTFIVIRRDAVSRADLSKPLTVAFEIDNTIVDSYNSHVAAYNAAADIYNKDLDANDDGFDELDEIKPKPAFKILEQERYSIENTSVTFAAGEYVKYVPMTLDPTGNGTSLGMMDFTANYGLGVKFTSSGDYTPTDEGNHVLVQVVVKNQYDGVYSLNVEMDGWSAYNISNAKPEDYSGGCALITAGATSVSFFNLYRDDDLLAGFSVSGTSTSPTGFGAASPVFVFDNNNKLVDVYNAYPDDGRGRAFALNPNATASENLYDPDKQKIIANFLFKQNGRPNCVVKYIMEYKGPR